MKFKTTLVTLFIFLFISSFNGNAQQTKDSLKVTLDPIQVTALHSTISSADAPLSLSTYSRDLGSLSTDASLSLSAIGENLPGLWVNDRQNYALGERLTIRGVGWRAAFGVRGIQVVYNNIPLTVADGQTMINIVEPAFIRRAELIRGPAATYWGNSSGGVLYLSTKPNYDESSSVRIRTMAGSYGLAKGEAEVAISNPNHNFSLYSSYLTTNGYRDYSAADVYRGGFQGTVDLTSRSRLEYQSAIIHMPFARHPGSLTKQLAQDAPTSARSSFIKSGAGKSITQSQAGLSYFLDTSAGILNVTGYGIYRDLSNPLPFGIITVNRWAGGLRSTLDKNWNNINLQVGLETKLQNDDRTEFDNTGNNGEAIKGNITVNQIERVWNQAVFANATYSAGNFNVMGGLRFDRLTFSTDTAASNQIDSRTFQALSPSLGINFQTGEQTLFANLSTSFEAPTTTELVNNPENSGGFNPNLKPEKTIGAEIGARGSSSSGIFTYDLAIYRLWISDLLFPYQLQNNGPTYYRNQGETRHSGIEAQFSIQLDENWSLQSTNNISRAEFKKAQTLNNTSLAGKSVPGIPAVRSNTTLEWSPRQWNTSISYEYVSNYVANNLNTAENEPYGVLDFSLGHNFMFDAGSVSVRPFLNLNNLLDIRYNGSVVVNAYGGRYYEPAPGRNWQAGISVDF